MVPGTSNNRGLTVVSSGKSLIEEFENVFKNVVYIFIRTNNQFRYLISWHDSIMS